MATKLVKEVVSVNGLPTVVSKILPQNNIKKHVVVLIPGNPGLVEFYDVFITTLFDNLHGQVPVYAISHAGKCKREAGLCNFIHSAVGIISRHTSHLKGLIYLVMYCIKRFVLLIIYDRISK